MTEFRSTRRSIPHGRVTTEILLIVLVPSLTLGIFAWCDSDIAKSLLAVPHSQAPRISDPITDAVRIDDDKVLTTHLMGQMRLWSFSKRTPLGEVQSHVAPISCVAYEPRQNLLAVGSKIGQVEVWNIDRSEPLAVRTDPDLEHVNDCQFTPDGRTLMTAGEFGQLIEWDALTLTRRRAWSSTLASESIRTLAISADGKTMLAGKFLGLVQVWDLQRGHQIASHQVSVPVKHAESCIDAVKFISQDREFIAIVRGEGVGIWNVETGSLVRRFEGTFEHLKGGTLSPDGKRFVAGTRGGEIITWDTATGKLVGPVKQLRTTTKCMLHSADSRALLTGDWFGQVLFHHAP